MGLLAELAADMAHALIASEFSVGRPKDAS